MRRPRLGSIPYGKVIESCTVPGTIALTFNDGPWTYTSDLLDLLESEDVRATFFVCGSNMDSDQITGHGNPDVLQRMIDDGHQIGSHTWGHPDLTTLSEEEAFRAIFRNERALLEVFGFLPTYLRPPYLSANDNILKILNRLGYHVISLDLDTHDWTEDYEESESHFSDVIGYSDPRIDSHLVLAHDIHEQTVYDFVQFMIDEGKEAGYRFVTVGECLGDHQANWYRNVRNGRSWITKNRHMKSPIRRDRLADMTSTVPQPRGLDPFYAHLKQTMYEPEVAAFPTVSIIMEAITSHAMAARSVRPMPTTTFESDFHVELERVETLDRGRFHRGGPKIAKIHEPATTASSSTIVASPASSKSDLSSRGDPLVSRGVDWYVSGEHQEGNEEEETDEEVVTIFIMHNNTALSTSICGGLLPLEPDETDKANNRQRGNTKETKVGDDAKVPLAHLPRRTHFPYAQYSGGPISKAPSTFAFVVGIAVMVIYVA